jgi:hypothetical protein
MLLPLKRRLERIKDVITDMNKMEAVRFPLGLISKAVFLPLESPIEGIMVVIIVLQLFSLLL